MRHSFLTIRILVWIISLYYARGDEDVFVPASSPMILYDNGWTNYTNPNYMMSKNGTFYFMFRGSNITIHRNADDVGPNLNMWVDGINFFNMSETANYYGASSIDPTLSVYPLTLGYGDHHIHLSYSTPENTSYSPFVLGGISVSSRDGSLSPSVYGINPTQFRTDRIIDDSSLEFSGPWTSENQSPFSYNQTSTTLENVGSSVQLVVPHNASVLGVYGRSPSVNTRINVTITSPENRLRVLINMDVGYSGKNDSLIQVPLWIYGSNDSLIDIGSTIDIALAQGGALNVDYVLLQYSDKIITIKTNKKILAIVVPVVVASLIIVGGITFLWWRRRQRSKWKNHSEIALNNAVKSSDNRRRRDVDLSQHPYQSRSEVSLGLDVVPPHVSPQLIPLPSSVENATSSQSGATASGSLPSNPGSHPSEQLATVSEIPDSPRAGSLPTWSPPPPSYQSMSIIASEEAQSRGMLPLSQEALERLYQRVIALRRRHQSSGQGGDKLDHIPEGDEEEYDEELEALARRIAGIGTPGRLDTDKQ